MFQYILIIILELKSFQKNLKKNIKPTFLKELAKENFSHVIIANKTKIS